MARVKRGFDHLLDRARDLREETTGRLVIGANPVLSADFMPRLIERFARAHPGVQIQLESDNGRNLIEAWLSGMIDIGFVTRSAGSRALAGASTLQANHLIDIGTVFALPAGHRLANAARIDLADLAGEPFVALTGDAGSRRELDAALARAGAPVRIVAEASTPLAAVALVARGLGVALVSDLAVFACAGRDRVVARPISPPIGSVIDYAVSDEKRQSPLVKAFLAMAHADAAGIHRDIVGDPFG